MQLNWIKLNYTAWKMKVIYRITKYSTISFEGITFEICLIVFPNLTTAQLVLHLTGREHYTCFTLFGNFIHSSTLYSTNYSTCYEKNMTTSALVRSIRWKTRPKHWNPGTYISKILDHCGKFPRVLQLYHCIWST